MVLNLQSRLVSISLQHYFMIRCRFSSLFNCLSPLNFLSTLSEDPTKQKLQPKSWIFPTIDCQEPSISPPFLPLCKDVKSLNQIHAHLILHDLMKDEFVVIEMLKICFDLDAPHHGLLVFHSVEKPTSFLRNWMLRLLSHHDLHQELLLLYSELNDRGFASDNFTFPFVIKACAATLDLESGKEVHSAVLRNGFQRNVVIQTAIVDMYAKVGCMKTSRRVFDGISQRDLVCWNALLSGYSLNGLDWEAFDAFRQIMTAGFKPNVSTLVSIIPACTRFGVLRIAKSVHAFLVRCGTVLDEGLAPALISMYGGCGDLFASRLLFGLVPTKDVVTFNAMISSCTQNRQFEEAFEIFHKMHWADSKPGLVTLVSILPYCANLASTGYSESLHAYSIKQGFEHRSSVATALVTMYAKLGELYSAESVFYGMTEKNLLSWNSMVSGYFQNRLYNFGFNAFCKMQLAGLRPDSVSMVSVISASAKLGDLLLGKSAHAFSIRYGYDSNLNLLNALLAMYSDCGWLSISLKLFDRMHIRNLISWNSLISGSVQNGDAETAAAIFCQMREENVDFDLITMISILSMCDQAENITQGMSSHCHAIKVGYDQDVSFTNALISMYVCCQDLKAGKLVFDNMATRDVISWNALMTGYRNFNLSTETIILFQQMIMDGQNPNSVTLLNVLPVCQSQLQGKSIHAYALRAGCILESPLVTSLICMYDRFENVNACCLLFEIGDKQNVVLWNTIMLAHARTKHTENAIACFRKMLQMVIEPDSVSILNLLTACLQLGSLDSAQCTMAYIFRKGFNNNIAVANALIDIYARCGSIQTARQLFDGMEEKDAVTWSVMVNGYGMHGNCDAAFNLFSEMKLQGVQPDDVTFIGLLSACSHAGQVNQSRLLFDSMIEEHQIQPRIEHYACMVDLLGRTGWLDEAYDLVKKMPFKPSISMLESLLGACSVHGNTELAEEVGLLLLELDPENSRLYVMLSNAYAFAGRWSDASRVRAEIGERGLRKVPGFSAIEVNTNMNTSLIVRAWYTGVGACNQLIAASRALLRAAALTHPQTNARNDSLSLYCFIAASQPIS
ncbi:hypothetical protein ACLOJK_026132 [Asimina triloba]